MIGNYSRSLADPLVAVRVAADLIGKIRSIGLEIETSEDFHRFVDARCKLRDGSAASPLFDPAATSLDNGRGLWMLARDANGEHSALQAFRADMVETNLAEWALGWVIGIYLKRGELVVPAHNHPPNGSIANKVAGVCVYHGELWIARSVKEKSFVEWFSRLGLILSFLKWQPAAIWALIGSSMATRGHMTRMGYAHMERGFMRWEFLPDGADTNEWLGLSDRSCVEHMINEMAATL